MTRYAPALLLILGLVLLVGACSDDDPVDPGTPPPDAPMAATPDSLMSIYRTAVEDMNLDGFPDLFHPDFRMAVSAWEGDFVPLLTDHMTRDETILAAGNMFGGQDVMNWQGVSMNGVTRFTIHQWERLTEWKAAKDGDEDPPPGKVTSLWALRMFVERGSGYSLLSAAGTYEVTAAVATDADQETVWVLTGMAIVPDGKGETYGWAGVNLLYLTNEAPTAVIDVTETPGEVWPQYTFDPTGSLDQDSGLADLPFRWREGGENFIGDPLPWSEWTTEPYVVTFESEEEQTVNLEVRDRWGTSARATKTVFPTPQPLEFSGDPSTLMKNFQRVYEERRFDGFREMMHPDFQMTLQQDTVGQFPDLGSTLDINEELRIHERMFSGDDVVDPNGLFVPGVIGISFGRLEPLDDWQESPADDPIPNALFTTYNVDVLIDRGWTHTSLSVKGAIRFYVTSRDSFYQGADRKYYQMIGQVDLTGAGGKAVEGSTWGGAKALYR